MWERAGCVNSYESLVSGPQLPLSGMVWELAAVQSQPYATPAGDSSSRGCVQRRFPKESDWMGVERP